MNGCYNSMLNITENTKFVVQVEFYKQRSWCVDFWISVWARSKVGCSFICC